MNRPFLKIICVWSIFALIFSGCVRGLSEPDITDTSVKKVFIINQGSPGQNNPSLTVFDPRSGQIIQNAYQLANNTILPGRPSDIFISAGSAYLLLQNEHRLEVIRTSDYRSTGHVSFPAFSAPDRIILNSQRTRAYISHTADSIISVVDLDNLSLIDTIKVTGEPRGLSIIRNLLVISLYNNAGGNSILLYNVNTNQFENEIGVGNGPIEVMSDFEDRIWVLCQGSFDLGITGSLYRVDRDFISASRWVQFTSLSSRMSWDGSLYIYVIAGGNIQRVFTANPNQATTWLQSTEGTVIRSIQADGSANELYAAVSITGQQNGKLRIYNRLAELRTTVTVGANPYRVVFEY